MHTTIRTSYQNMRTLLLLEFALYEVVAELLTNFYSESQLRDIIYNILLKVR